MSQFTHTLRRLCLCASLALTALAAHAATEVDAKNGAVMQSQGAMLIDVREPDEYAQGHAPGATLIPLGQLEQHLAELGNQKGRPIALICRSGVRSAKAQVLMEKAGFSQAVNVEGGMNAWVKAGLPVVTGPNAK
jgi:rhodanese-related sulfurtransferase